MASRWNPLVRTLGLATVAGLLLGAPSVSEAASRVTFQLADPTVDVYLDQQPVRPMGAPNKRTANHIAAGSHTVIIQQNGQVLSSTSLDIPDGASVVVQVGATGALQVSGATVSSGPSASSSSSADDGPAGGSALGAAQDADRLSPEETADSFDMNEGGGGGSVQGGERLAGGDYATFTTAATTTGRVVGGAVLPGMGGVVAGSVAPAAARGAVSLARNAEAGGLSALQGGSSFRQGRPVPKKADTGTVAFSCPAQDPIVIYLEGFIIASVGPGSQKAKTKLEVGRHKLEFMDAETGQYIYRGVVEVEKDEVITLEIADAHPPKALDRTWAWSAR